MLLPIETKNPYFGRYLYPAAKEIMEEQQDSTWTAQEIAVENDIHDFRALMTPEQLNLTSVTLQLFVEIEQEVGDIWEIIASWFPHSEIEGAAMEIARMEKSVHAFFYQKISDTLNIEPEEIAKNQEEIKVLKDKLTFLRSIMTSTKVERPNKPLILATVTMIEQVLLFSNFGMLKSFKANGNNLMKNTLHGVDYVINDEQLHGSFSAYLFKVYLEESKKAGIPIDIKDLYASITTVIEEIISHEDGVIDYTFPGEISINDITGAQLKTFIRSRANEALELLGLRPYYYIAQNPIADWFYRGTKSIKSHDFFSAGTTQYSRTWKLDNFSVLPFLEEDFYE